MLLVFGFLFLSGLEGFSLLSCPTLKRVFNVSYLVVEEAAVTAVHQTVESRTSPVRFLVQLSASLPQPHEVHFMTSSFSDPAQRVHRLLKKWRTLDLERLQSNTALYSAKHPGCSLRLEIIYWDKMFTVIC